MQKRKRKGVGHILRVIDLEEYLNVSQHDATWFVRVSMIAQHQHEPELLVPGTICDIWREPARKDECGWRGPAESISIERRAGSAIVKHQGATTHHSSSTSQKTCSHGSLHR